MGFVGWGRRCELVTQHAQVEQDCYEFPMLIHKDSLPSESLDADGSYYALNGGGDIRLSSDQAGDSQLPCEIESFVTDNDPANGKAAIWTKRTLSSASDTSTWIWYHKSGESQPAEDSAYGKEAVYDANYVMVQHMNQDPSGDAPQMIDSTSNNNDGTSSGSMTADDQVEGQIDGCLDLDGGNDHVSSAHSSSLNISGAITISAFVYMHSAGSYPAVVTKAESQQDWGYNLQFAVATRKINLYLEPANEAWDKCANTAVPLNTQTYIGAIYDGLDNIKYYYNGNPDGSFTVTGGGIRSNIGALLIGKRIDGFLYDGLVDEVHISNIVRLAGWLATEYNSQYSPITFLIPETPETPVAYSEQFKDLLSEISAGIEELFDLSVEITATCAPLPRYVDLFTQMAVGVISFPPVRREFTVMKRTTDFTIVPRVTDFIIVPRTIDFTIVK